MSWQRLVLPQGKTLVCLGEMAFSTLRNTVLLKGRGGSSKLLSRMEISVTSSPSCKPNSTSLSVKRLLRCHTKGPEDQLDINPFSTWMCKLFNHKELGNDSSGSLKTKEDVEGDWIHVFVPLDLIHFKSQVLEANCLTRVADQKGSHSWLAKKNTRKKYPDFVITVV